MDQVIWNSDRNSCQNSSRNFPIMARYSIKVFSLVFSCCRQIFCPFLLFCNTDGPPMRFIIFLQIRIWFFRQRFNPTLETCLILWFTLTLNFWYLKVKKKKKLIFFLWLEAVFILCYPASHLQQIHWNENFCRMYGLGVILSVLSNIEHLSNINEMGPNWKCFLRLPHLYY